MVFIKNRNTLFRLLGDLPPLDGKINAECIHKEKADHYELEEIRISFDGENETLAYFVRPLHKNGPYKTILFNHSHGGNYTLGKDELIHGNVYLQMPPYAEEFAKMGYASFCFDAWGFGSRSNRTEGELFKEMLWQGEVLWGRMVYDSIRAVDYLCSREDVQSDAIGTLGMSMGGVMAWWLSALEERIQVCVNICGMVEFDALIESRNLEGHGIYFYVPSLLKHFTTGEINALIAPRPHICLVGNKDDLTPKKGIDRVDEYLQTIYEQHEKQEAWKMVREDVGHEETPKMRQEIKSFLKTWL